MSDERYFIYLIDFNTFDYLALLHQHQDVVLDHLSFLKDLHRVDKLVFAGTSLDNFYEFVIIRVYDDNLAKAIFDNDPLVKHSIFPSSFYPFRVSFISSENLDQALLTDNLDIFSFYKMQQTSYFFGTTTAQRRTFINDISVKGMQVIGEHFEYLKKNFTEKKIVLAGSILSEETFDVIIFNTRTKEEAEEILLNDPSVKAKMMSPSLHPFNIFLVG
ncbi:MAG: hypothetical protein ACTSQE_13235 [Candidatus Heimdallarchaeaceae archaeon]